MSKNKTRIVIYGAGRGGYMVAEVLRFDPAVQIVGMVDDNVDIWEKRVADIAVLGGREHLINMWTQNHFDAAVISMCRASHDPRASATASVSRRSPLATAGSIARF